MAESLSYEALKEMNFASYKKAFKEKSQWKKAKALVVLVDYKLGSRKVSIVLPLRRSNQLKPLLKQIKQDKHPNQKLAAGALQLGKGENGPQMTFKMTHGAYSLEALEGKVAPTIQQLLKYTFVAELGSEVDAVETTAKTVEDTAPALPSKEQAPSDSAAPTESVEGEQANRAVQKEQQNELVALFKQAKEAVTKEAKPIVERFKKKANVFDDSNLLQAAVDKVEAFLSKYKSADDALKKKLAPAQQKLAKQQATLTQLDQKLDAVELTPQSPEEVDQAITNLEKRIQALQEKIAQQQ